MIQMQAQQNVGGIAGLAVLTPTVHGDDRGYFMETYNQRDMESLGFHYDFVQDNQSGSTYGVLRGCTASYATPRPSWCGWSAARYLMWQWTCDRAAILICDGTARCSLRRTKSSFDPCRVCPRFLVLSQRAEFCYKVTDFFTRTMRAAFPGTIPRSAWSGPFPGYDLAAKRKDKHWEYLK